MGWNENDCMITYKEADDGNLEIIKTETLEVLRADLEAVAVAAERYLASGIMQTREDLEEVLARDGVQAVLEGVKDG